MAQSAICYGDDIPPYYYNVTYIVLATRTKLTRSFDSEYFARQFVNKLRRSKKCMLVSYPIFR